MIEVSNYDEALEYIHGRHKFTKDPSLKRMRRFAEIFGDPQESLQMIHVTGTNGKGSVTAYLRDLLMEQGYDVGTFTSPFIEKFNERISVNGKMISDEEILSLVQEILPAVEQLDHEFVDLGGPTEFEVLTMMMFVYFGRYRPDFVIVEVGIGGTYDSTNIITPLLSVITSVGMDHMQILGNTLTEIAENKAGIIKHRVPVVCGQLPSEAQSVIEKKAQLMDSRLYLLNQDFTVVPKSIANFRGETFDFRFNEYLVKDVQIQMVGGYQISNAAVALTAFLVMMSKHQISVKTSQIKKCLQQTTWPGRFEKVNDEPLIVLDGAHNVPAIKGLTKTLKAKFNDQHVYILLAVLEDKQFNEMIAELTKLSHVTIVLTKFHAPRATLKKDELDSKYDQIKMFDQWNEGFLTLINEMSADDMLLITGSLYFVSEVRRYFKEE